VLNDLNFSTNATSHRCSISDGRENRNMATKKKAKKAAKKKK
jgi:hypothetical protein